MEFHFLLVFALLNIVFAGSLGAEQEEAYWKSVFPNNEMPKSLKEILPTPDSDSFGEYNTPTDLGKNHENDRWKAQLSDSTQISDSIQVYGDNLIVDSKGNHKNGGWKAQLFDSTQLSDSIQVYGDNLIVDSKNNHKNGGWKVQLSDSINGDPQIYGNDLTDDSKGNHKNGGWKVQLSDSINGDPQIYGDDSIVHSKGTFKGFNGPTNMRKSHGNDGWKVQLSDSISREPKYYGDVIVDSKGTVKEFNGPTNIQKGHENDGWKVQSPDSISRVPAYYVDDSPVNSKDSVTFNSFNTYHVDEESKGTFKRFNGPTNIQKSHENEGWKVESSDSISRVPAYYVDDLPVDSKGPNAFVRFNAYYVDDSTVDSKNNHANGDELLKDSKDSGAFKRINGPTNMRKSHKNNGWKVPLSGSRSSVPAHYVDDLTVDSKNNHANGEEPLKKSKGIKDVSEVHNNDRLIKTFFFLQKDLRRGKLVNHTTLITSDRTPFLSDRIAKSIPFSSNKLPEILNHFSLNLGTKEADAVKDTIRGCELVAMRGEEKFCATSFESLVDSSVSKLGKQIQLLTNELSKETKDPLFTIGRGIRNMGENAIICHKMGYPGAVFLCHSIDKTVVYKVPLVGRDGTKANALAVCHKDTSAWTPTHMAFKELNLKPGSVPICHFLVRDTLVWVSN